MLPDLSRVIVVGNSGSGKTTFARELAAKLKQPCIEMDVLQWLPGWQERPLQDFAKRVDQATAGERWIVDGNYGKLREITTYWSRATTVLWLNYSFSANLMRGLRRTLGRIFTQKEVFDGCHENIRGTFFSRDSVLLWIITHHRVSRRNFTVLRSSNRYAQLQWIEFRRPAEARQFLARITKEPHN